MTAKRSPRTRPAGNGDASPNSRHSDTETRGVGAAIQKVARTAGAAAAPNGGVVLRSDPVVLLFLAVAFGGAGCLLVGLLGVIAELFPRPFEWLAGFLFPEAD